MQATYSPEDNKLRLYPEYRLDTDTYKRAKDLGFRWAPKQELFVAPSWSPAREDFLIELCGEVGDEDTTLVDRAEQRADRFSDYSSKRASDAETYNKAVSDLTDNIPLGQPILVGHQSERAARKVAEKIERTMEKVVTMWERSEYWQYRAQGVLRNAKYKERPDVRARRIKKLEAENRKYSKSISEAETFTKLWNTENLTHAKAMQIANYSHVSHCFTLAEYPRPETVSQYEGPMGLWSAMDSGVITAEQAKALALPVYARTIAHYTRMVAHNDRRLAYEKAILAESGQSSLLDKPKRPKQPPLLNYRCPEGIDIPNKYNPGSVTHYPQTVMTKAEYAKIPKDYKGGEKYNGHRVRVAMGAYCGVKGDMNARHAYHVVFLSDSKEHPKPE